MNHLINLSADQRAINQIAKTYSTLDYSPQLVGFLESLFPDENFTTLGKYELHKTLNYVLCHQYKGEQSLKYALFCEFVKKKVVAAFEINVGKSRADFITINGASSSFEIKSTLDNLNKLPKQALDYQLAFDYNYVVIDEKHLENVKTLVPSCFGIWSFSKGKKKVHQDPLLNINIDPEFQLRLLTKKERQEQFRNEQGDIHAVLKYLPHEEINIRFKRSLKGRYQNRWNFLTAHHELILPIDVQFFFNYNIEPRIIYHN